MMAKACSCKINNGKLEIIVVFCGIFVVIQTFRLFLLRSVVVVVVSFMKIRNVLQFVWFPYYYDNLRSCVS